MLSYRIGRKGFFYHTTLVGILELVFLFVAIASIMGFQGFLESKPGPGREHAGAAVLVISLVAVILRSNLAWRRTRDSGGSKFVLGSYIVLSIICALIQAATFLVYDLSSQSGNIPGAGTAGLGVSALWWSIFWPKSAEDGPDAPSKPHRNWRETNEAASGLSLLSDAELVARAAALRAEPAPAYLKSQAAPAGAPAVQRSSSGFGRRGLT